MKRHQVIDDRVGSS